MHCGETAETFKVGHLQREYMAHTVNAHGGGQSRIVHLNTHYLVPDDNPAPLSINGFTIWQKTHADLDCTHLTFSLGHRQTKTIALLRARHYVPKLSDVLVGIVKNCALESEPG
jgi:hypothetical protein